MSVTWELRGPAAWITFDRPRRDERDDVRHVRGSCSRSASRRTRRGGAGGRAARRGRQGVRGGHRHRAVHGVRERRGRAALRGDDRPHRRAARDRAQADCRARARDRDGQRAGAGGGLRPARVHARGEVRAPDRAHGRQLPVDGQLRAAGVAAGRGAREGRGVHGARDPGRRGAGDRARDGGRRRVRRSRRTWTSCARAWPATRPGRCGRPRRRCGGCGRCADGSDLVRAVYGSEEFRERVAAFLNR